MDMGRGVAGSAVTPRRLAPTEGRTERLWRRCTQIAVIASAVVILAAALAIASAVLIPIVAAVIIGSVIGPAIEGLAKRGVPSWLGALLMVIGIAGLIYGLAVALAAPLAEWSARAPEIGAIMKERFAGLRPVVQTLASVVESIQSMGRATERAPVMVEMADSKMLESVLSLVTPVIGQFILFLGSLLFFLAGRVQIKRRVVQVMTPRQTRLTALRVFREIEDRLGAYLVTATFINIGLGIATTLVTWGLGMPNPPLWGVLACVLNYVPYVGPAVTTLILAIAGVVTFPGILEGLLPAAAFLFITSIEGQFLTPMIVGRRVSLNPFAVFLSMAVWTWLWGPAGTFLSVPLLIAAMALVDGMLAKSRPHLPG